MNEPVDFALEVAGEDLVFDGFTIRGLPGFNLSKLYQGEQSPYIDEIQNFSIQTLSTYARANEISKNDTFTISDKIYLYEFKLNRNPVHDFTGWCELHCDYIGKDEV